MRIDVLYFGVLKDLAGTSARTLQLDQDARVSDVLALTGGSEAVWRSLAVAVNRVYASLETVLHDGDEVALLPPVSGGCHAD